MVKKQTAERSKDELQVAVVALRTEIGKLEMENAKRQLKNTTSLQRKKDELARLLTQMNMMKFIEKKGDKNIQINK